ncbi:hypothetical protein [Sinorhizobium sp. BG8]|uniref:hypothetical protein n=1 Tax=Sinorhizobium sp. BG8 TaxID=2613773 RepID=UPI00193E2253|nr:hypothetical protein [Sinorhizobium sp. BG8]QRM56270.1 hypothetical protein F3Y30_18290 [Sinorhizobium sp. BG8]
MHELKTRLALIGLLVAVTGCSSTDALTPQVDIPGGFQSPPVTQNDLDAVGRNEQPVGMAQQRTVRTHSQEYGDTSTTTALSSPSGGRDTAGTLEGQAAALARNGSEPLANETVERRVETEAEAPTRAARQEQKQEQVAAASSSSEGDTIRFLPIIGAPVNAVTPLSKRLGAQARASGLTIKSASDTSSKFILKGYFSAMNDNGGTTVVYVWDVLDGSGARLHRIQGQDTIARTATDPWAAVPPEVMENIAAETIREYLEWRRQAPG